LTDIPILVVKEN